MQAQLNHLKSYSGALFNLNPSQQEQRIKADLVQQQGPKSQRGTKSIAENKRFLRIPAIKKTSCGVSPGTFPHFQNNNTEKCAEAIGQRGGDCTAANPPPLETIALTHLIGHSLPYCFTPTH